MIAHQNYHHYGFKELGNDRKLSLCLNVYSGRIDNYDLFYALPKENSMKNIITILVLVCLNLIACNKQKQATDSSQKKLNLLIKN